MDTQNSQPVAQQTTKPSRHSRTTWVVVVVILALIIAGVVMYMKRRNPQLEEIRIGEALLKAAKNPTEAEKEAVAKDLAVKKSALPEISDEKESEIINYLNS